ncbi:GntR family transcriptional regulator [Nocardioides pyridinolyticus]
MSGTATSELTSALRGFGVDRSSPIPLYFQVSGFIEQAIESGQIPNGSLFANEIQLAEQLGLSRPTVRRAMQDLVDKGLIVRRRGIGTRVVQPKVRRPLELSSLFDDLAGSGQKPTTAVLEVSTVAADDEVALQLGIPVDTEVLRVVRLRSAKGNPIAKMTNYLPEQVGGLTQEDLEQHGLYELMRGRGIHLHAASQTVGARTATPAEAKLLDERRNAALLTMQRTTYDDQGTVVEFGSHIYAASRYSFEISLLAP